MSIALGLALGVPFLPGFGGVPYVSEGLVLDYTTDVGPFQIVDQSSFDNLGTLYSGRGVFTDGVNNKIVLSESEVLGRVTVWVKPVGTQAKAYLGTGGGVNITGLTPDEWQEISFSGFAPASELILGWDGTSFSSGAWADCKATELGQETAYHWTLSDHADLDFFGLSGMPLVDSGINKRHGYCDGCSGFTGEGINSEVSGIIGLDDAWWFNGVDSAVNMNSSVSDYLNFTFSCNVILNSKGSNSYVYSEGVNGSEPYWGIFVNQFDSPAFIVRTAEGETVAITASTKVLEAYTQYKIEVSVVNGDYELKVDGVVELSGTYTTLTGTASFTQASIGSFRRNSQNTYYPGTVWDVNVDGVSAYTGQGTDAWVDTIGSNDGVGIGSLISLGQKRTTILQTVDRNWNKYQVFNGVDTQVNGGSLSAFYLNNDKVTVKFILGKFIPTGASQYICSFGANDDQNIGIWRSGAGLVYIDMEEGDSQFYRTLDTAETPAGEVICEFVKSTTTVTLTTGNGTVTNNSPAGSFYGRVGLDLSIGWRNTNSTFYLKGSLINLQFLGETDVVQHFYSGIGNDPWKDLVGGVDGVESGSFSRQLVSASDSDDLVDAYGEAILEPRVNTQIVNLFGDGESVITPDSDSLDLTTDGTWEIWGNFYYDVEGTQYIWSKSADSSGTNISWALSKSSGYQKEDINWITSSDGSTTSTATITITGVPDRIICVHIVTIGGVTSGYIDGQSATMGGSFSSPLFVSAEPVVIGGDADGGLQVGSTKIYNRGLSAEEVLQNYDEQKDNFLAPASFNSTDFDPTDFN